jgi:hypothetical protein
MFLILSYLVPDLPRLLFRLLRAVQWLLLGIFYFSVACYILACIGLVRAFERSDLAGTALFPILPLVAVIALAWFAFKQDKRREALGLDDFRGDWLFFRYGQEIDHTTISIPVKANWGFKETEVSAVTLRTTLAERIAARLPYSNVKVMVRKLITDRQTNDQKEFTRVLIQSAYGSSVTLFIHYACFGQTITAHYFIYRRGTYDLWSVLRFLLMSPFTMWLWIIPWLLNRDSIIARISEYRGSSFEAIDLQTMFGVAHRVIYEETAETLKQVGLWTEEIQKIINYNIQNVRSLQNVAINNSPNAVMAGVDVVSTETGRPARQPLAAER